MKDINELNLHDKKYIIFDNDGTLVDSIGLYTKADGIIIEQYGNVCVSEDIIEQERDIVFRKNASRENLYLEYADYLINRYNFSIKDKHEILKNRALIDKTLIKEELTLRSHVAELLYLLKKYGFTLVIATMTTRNAIDNAFKGNQNISSLIDIDEVFDYIITMEDVTHKKPHPEVFNKILEHYNTSCDKCLIVEDSLTGVLAANASNIEVMTIEEKHSLKDKALIQEHADYYIEDFKTFIDYLEKQDTKKYTLSKKKGCKIK